MYTIELAVPDRSPIVVRVADEPVRLGLDPANDVVLDDPDRSVSRFHAELRIERGRLVLIDLNSEAGSFVDGRRVSRAELGRASVGQLGPFRLRVLQGPGVEAVATGALSGGQVSPGTAWLRRLAMGVGFVVLLLLAVGMGRWFAGFETGSQAAPPAPVDAGEVAAGPSRPEAGPSAPNPPPEVESLLRQARAALDTGDLEIARGHLEAILAEAPDQQEALALRARLDELTRAEQAPPAPAPPREAPAAPRRSAPPRAAPEPRLTGIERDLQRMYDNALAAAEAGNLRLAISNLRAVVNIDEGYRDAKARHDALVAQGNASIDREIEAAQAAEAQNEPAKAIAAYRRAVVLAERLDVALQGVDAAIERNQARMVEAGTEAYRQARQYDALGRSADAIALYRRAVELLPEDDPNRQAAVERLAALR